VGLGAPAHASVVTRDWVTTGRAWVTCTMRARRCLVQSLVVALLVVKAAWRRAPRLLAVRLALGLTPRSLGLTLRSPRSLALRSLGFLRSLRFRRLFSRGLLCRLLRRLRLWCAAERKLLRLRRLDGPGTAVAGRQLQAPSRTYGRTRLTCSGCSSPARGC
jgi:hypothetical protein